MSILKHYFKKEVRNEQNITNQNDVIKDYPNTPPQRENKEISKGIKVIGGAGGNDGRSENNELYFII